MTAFNFKCKYGKIKRRGSRFPLRELYHFVLSGGGSRRCRRDFLSSHFLIKYSSFHLKIHRKQRQIILVFPFLCMNESVELSYKVKLLLWSKIIHTECERHTCKDVRAKIFNPIYFFKISTADRERFSCFRNEIKIRGHRLRFRNKAGGKLVWFWSIGARKHG